MDVEKKERLKTQMQMTMEQGWIFFFKDGYKMLVVG